MKKNSKSPNKSTIENTNTAKKNVCGFFSPQRLSDFFNPKKVFTARNICIMGMMVALAVVLDQFTIQLTPQQKLISISYIPNAITAMLFGPIAAIFYGFAVDTVKFFINSHGSAYFPGYAISEVVGCLTYACFMYKQKITVSKVIASRAIITVVVYLGLNFLWGSILWGQEASKFYTSVKLINNLVQFPIHAAIVYAVGKAFDTVPELKKLKYSAVSYN